jgi:hypothetical protein
VAGALAQIGEHDDGAGAARDFPDKLGLTPEFKLAHANPLMRHGPWSWSGCFAFPLARKIDMTSRLDRRDGVLVGQLDIAFALEQHAE